MARNRLPAPRDRENVSIAQVKEYFRMALKLNDWKTCSTQWLRAKAGGIMLCFVATRSHA